MLPYRKLYMVYTGCHQKLVQFWNISFFYGLIILNWYHKCPWRWNSFSLSDKFCVSSIFETPCTKIQLWLWHRTRPKPRQQKRPHLQQRLPGQVHDIQVYNMHGVKQGISSGTYLYIQTSHKTFHTANLTTPTGSRRFKPRHWVPTTITPIFIKPDYNVVISDPYNIYNSFYLFFLVLIKIR